MLDIDGGQQEQSNKILFLLFLVMVLVTVGVILWANQSSGLFDFRSRASGFAPTPTVLLDPTTAGNAQTTVTSTPSPTPNPEVTKCLDACLKNPQGGFQPCYNECYKHVSPTPVP